MRRVDSLIMDHSHHTEGHNHTSHEGHNHSTMLDNGHDNSSSTSSSSMMDHSSMGHDHSAMGHGMHSMTGPSCKMDMYWNWYTLDACFLSKSWHITSAGMFAGSCIGIVFLVVIVEGFRRLARELDRYIVRDWKKRAAAAARGVDVSIPADGAKIVESSESVAEGVGSPAEDAPVAGATAPVVKSTGKSKGLLSRFCPYPTASRSPSTPRPTFLQLLLKSFIYAVLIGVSYILMLLAMYYNGYIFFCLVIGAWLGNFLFGWDTCVLDESVVGAERGCGC
ncbi:hypothetical protein ABW19_dt0206830 [Dactylella cylindrospora]|nr:hypothetical protein ABW19_dt0206830 [Dactylella cylindrospora]